MVTTDIVNAHDKSSATHIISECVVSKEKKHYNTIDVLRVVASVGIVMMHIRANNHYSIDGFLYNLIIPSFTDFVFLFMTISAFGLCCGYYEKFTQGNVSLSSFYNKRFGKIFPFFAMLVLLDMIISPSMNVLYEAFADLTLMFGFLPHAGRITVVGVGWFLGLIFVFYICFPFFCYILQNRRRAWIAFAISIMFNFACERYFNVGRENIIYSSMFFVAGGLIYLYRNEIEAINRWVISGILLFSLIGYYLIGGSFMCLLVSSGMLVYSIQIRSNKFVSNKIIGIVSAFSMEIYLSHMAIFQLIKKIHINEILGNGWIQYMMTVWVVLCGSMIFSMIVRWILSHIKNIIYH